MGAWPACPNFMVLVQEQVIRADNRAFTSDQAFGGLVLRYHCPVTGQVPALHLSQEAMYLGAVIVPANVQDRPGHRLLAFGMDFPCCQSPNAPDVVVPGAGHEVSSVGWRRGRGQAEMLSSEGLAIS